MIRAAFFFAATLGVCLAAPAPNLDVQIRMAQDGSAKLVLRNTHNAATQAYVVRVKCAVPPRTASNGQPKMPEWRRDPEARGPSTRTAETVRSLACATAEFRDEDSFLTGPARQIQPNGTVEFPMPAVPLVAQVGVIYADGAQAGDSDALREIPNIRAAVRSSIPFAVSALQSLASQPVGLPEAIRKVEGWRKDIAGGGFTRLAGERVSAPPESKPAGVKAIPVSQGRMALLNRILDTLRSKDAAAPRTSLSTAIDSAIESLRQTDAVLANPPVAI